VLSAFSSHCFFPKATERIAHVSLASAGISWGIGLLTVFIVIIASVILAITVILSPLAILAALALGIATLLGWIAFGYEIGSRIAAASNQKLVGPVAAGTGLLILNVIMAAFVIIPNWVGICLSAVLIFVVAMFGLGAVVLTRFGTHDYPESIPPKPVPPVPVPPIAHVQPIAPTIPLTSQALPPKPVR